jgi:hypothetical protein
MVKSVDWVHNVLDRWCAGAMVDRGRCGQWAQRRFTGVPVLGLTEARQWWLMGTRVMRWCCSDAHWRMSGGGEAA